MRKGLSILFIVWSTLSFAQRIEPSKKMEIDSSQFNVKNSSYIELGGNGILYSVNLDRILLDKNKFRTALRVGYSLLPSNRSLDQFFVGEHNFLFGKEKHFIETGLGLTYLYGATTSTQSYADLKHDLNQYFWISRLGYRFQNKKDVGTIIRAGITPMVYNAIDENDLQKHAHFLFWAGFSIGVSF